VEAFLRGADNKDQEYVASTGLMEHLVNEILKGGFRCAPLLQINFDLLGELIKFNKALFRELNRLLAGTKFDQFVEVLVANLVDSNVFVRSVVLSVDYFKKPQQMGTAISSSPLVCSAERQATLSSDNSKYGSTPSFRAKVEDELCMISAFVSHNTHRLLRDLMCAVQLSDINQDNICVLNTTLIFFILAEKNGELHGYLQTLRADDTCVLRTFRALLEFWRSYYLWKRGRECVSLQYSTQISFSNWLQIVDSLCAPPDLPCSLLYSGGPVGGIQCVALNASSEPPPRQQ
jgi:Trpc4-associated protein